MVTLTDEQKRVLNYVNSKSKPVTPIKVGLDLKLAFWYSDCGGRAQRALARLATMRKIKKIATGLYGRKDESSKNR